MSQNELQQLESLLFQALPDPRGFADCVLEQLLDRLATEPTGPQPVTVVQAMRGPSDTEIVLAAALGACECWGHDSGCTACAGRGTAGWTDPDEELYAEYVTPAVQRRAATNNRPNAPEPQEGVRP